MALEEHVEWSDEELEDLYLKVEEGEVELPEWIQFCQECGHLKTQSLDGMTWYCFKCETSW